MESSLTKAFPFRSFQYESEEPKKSPQPLRIRVIKNIFKYSWVFAQSLVFDDADLVIAPGIKHLCKVAIVHSDPSVEDSRHDLHQEKYHQLCMT